MVTPPAPCNHEEADTRMILHAANAAQYGHHNILIITVDTDVFVLAIAFMQKLKEDGVRGCWVGFGAGTHLRYIPVHTICDTLGPQVSSALPAFHAFTGCDTVSCFRGKGKKTAMETWNCFPEVTGIFLELSHTPEKIF